MTTTSIHVPSMDAEIRWTLKPDNWLTRLLWKFLDTNIVVQVEYIYMIMPREERSE